MIKLKTRSKKFARKSKVPTLTDVVDVPSQKPTPAPPGNKKKGTPMISVRCGDCNSSEIMMLANGYMCGRCLKQELTIHELETC